MTTARSILWIVTTQWRGQAWGGSGDPNVPTPSLDELAARGCNYRQATTPHPFGPFARAAMLTGVPCPENGVADYFDPLPSASQTIAHDAQQEGRETAFFGKWHLAKRDRGVPLVGEHHARQIVPPAQRGGFGFWEGFESGFLLNDPWLHGNQLSVPTQFEGYQSDVLAERARRWIETQRAPWFAVVSMEAPHPPYGAPAPAGVTVPEPEELVLAANVPPDAAPRARRELAGYYAHIEATDRAIGNLVKTLQPEVIVVVTSVHGDMHGAHGKFRKGWPEEESVRIPFVVANAPGQLAGSSSDEPISLLDLPAMTKAWLRGEDWACPREFAPLSMPSVVNFPDQCDRRWSGRRSMERKEIFGADGSPWLAFDLKNDPWEMNNLVSS
ncbi:MAG: hypothetical protein SynsKO_30840 [Synoicihabitans sp.]